MADGTTSLDPLDRYRAEQYEVAPASTPATQEEYAAFLRAHYEPLGFYCDGVLPAAGSRLFAVRHRETVVAIFRLTEVRDPASPYFALVPGACVDGVRRRLLEVNNVVVARAYRASMVLGLILYRSACEAAGGGFAFVVGMNRLSVLRFFVDFGVVPVEHAPLHLLGKAHLQDFVNYYDTADPSSLAYMHERARRYFHQERVMRSLQLSCSGGGRVPA